MNTIQPVLVTSIQTPNLNKRSYSHSILKSMPTVQSTGRSIRNSMYGTYHTASFYYGGSRFKSGYRIHTTTKEIKFFSQSDDINGMIPYDYHNLLMDYDEYPVFAKKYDAAVYLIDIELEKNEKLLRQFNKTPKHNNNFSRKNYKFNGYKGGKLEQLPAIIAKKNIVEKIDILRKEKDEIFINYPEWLI